MSLSRASRSLSVFAAWFVVFPPVLLLAVSVLRVLQPPQYEPARTSGMIFEWTTAHISRFGAGTLFLAMPSLAVFLGGGILRHAWRTDAGLRRDASAALEVLRRNSSIGLLTTATLLGAAVLILVIGHLIAG